MRFLIAVVLIALLSGCATWFFPWWTVSVVSFLVAILFGLKPGRAFLAGFAGVQSLWLFAALYIDELNRHILSVRMAELFHVRYYLVFILIASVVGGIAGGLGAWSGAALRKNLVRQAVND